MLLPTHTHCPYCGLQCAMSVSGGAVTPVEFPTNRGRLCQKGWTAAELLTHPGRLHQPLVRRGGQLRETSWDDALYRVARGFRRAQTLGGRDAVAVFGAGALTNEKAYLLGKFARVALGTANIDYSGRFCMAAAAEAGLRSFGLDRGLPFPVTDLDGAGAVLIFGGNPAETMPPFMQHLEPAAAAGGLMVVDPRRSATAERALRGNGVHLALTPGTDLPLALALTHLAVTEGLADRDYIAARTSGFEQFWAAASRWWPERAEQITGVSVSDMHRTVQILSRARNEGGGAYVLTARGAEQHRDGTDTVSAVIGLALVLGLCGRPGSGYGCVTGQANGQGGRELGQKASQLPGYRKITDPAARAHIGKVWDVDPGELPGAGKSAYEIFAALGCPGGIRALMVCGSNIAVSAPDAGRVIEGLRSLDLLVVNDFVMSETAQLADVVLPVLQWAEEEGTLTSLEGRVLRRRRSVAPPPGPRSELQILSELAVRLGQPANRFPASAPEVFDELRAATAGGPADYSGITYERLDAGQALHWPCPGPGHPGTPRLFLDRFATPDGKARFVPVEARGPAETVDSQFPLIATTGRLLTQYQSGAQTRRVAALAEAAGPMSAQMHPDVASRAGLADGDLVEVISRRGRTTATVRCDPTMRPDTVFLPFHFPGPASANRITNPVLDPDSGMPEFKVCAIRLQKPAPDQHDHGLDRGTDNETDNETDSEADNAVGGPSSAGRNDP
ncbi:molybdopterin oxidoreductase family protein [Mycobacteroides salmoniphilum]|uniref:molybdopterin oxidoreductase family protein n=1 Tax=Mycobacteroides salmoniphilum TaxID=404941 RepID=UPI0010646D4E|nr:molybdopterin oxidoreductase family protein [Mycobacteroides salmoniphilum]TDZ97083.1 Assimilatory nitrate reductase catalytic subunit [Mycobacteroides salmoniphilum]